MWLWCGVAAPGFIKAEVYGLLGFEGLLCLGGWHTAAGEGG